MEHFRIASANKSQETHFNNTSLSAVNALCLAADLPWEESYRLLLKQGKRYGLLLTEKQCWMNMLAEAGYVRIRGFRRQNSYASLSDYLMREHPGISHALAMTCIGQTAAARICAIRRDHEPGTGFTAMDLKEEKRNIVSLWLHYTEINAPKPQTDPLVIQPERILPSHKGYLYYQPNPVKRRTGDCVIRAYSAVLNQPWEETIDMLALSCEYKDTCLNSQMIYRSLTSEYEFDPHSRLVEEGKGLTGREFCDRMTLMCRNGERFFAKVGNNHVAGIIPTVIDGEKQYAVADSWDSSSEKIGSYWVYRPAKKKPKEAAPESLLTLKAGESLMHPVYGNGRIREIHEDEQRVVISFPGHGDTLMTCAWVRSNCQTARDQART